MTWNSRKLLISFVCAIHSLAFAHGQNAPDGQQIFSSTCAACHGLDGRGGEHAPDIATNAGVQHKTDGELTSIIRKGIPSGGMPAFGSLLDEGQTRAVLVYLRTLQRNEDQVAGTGDPSHGRVVFSGVGRCSECHTMNGHGGFLGADLSGYGGTHSAASIREWILDPNKNYDARHGTVGITMRDGRHYRGVIRNEDNFSLQMQTPDGTFKLFDKTDLVRVEHESQSLMPADYGKRLTTAELNDLVSFLAQAKGTTASSTDSEEEQ